MAIGDAMRPIPAGDFGYAQARHLLARAGFGGTPGQVMFLQTLGLDAAVDHLVDYEQVDDTELPEAQADPDVIKPLDEMQRKMARAAKREDNRAVLERLRADRLRRLAQDRRQSAELAQWWLARMISTPRPLQEKLVLLWHGHFASNHRTVRDSYLMLRQNDFFRQNASGNFAALAGGIVRDPAMILFLNNDSNRKQHPNENLARELMELFTLGEGNYTERDIAEGARALTGYGVEDNEFVLRKYQHDTGSKTILGARGAFDGDDFVRIILAKRQCAEFVAGKLYRHFVADVDGDPTPETDANIKQLARLVMQHRYELKPVLKALFKSRHFYEPAIMDQMIKSPVQVIVGTMRMLNTPARDVAMLTDAAAMMGQRLFDPPSVAGWAGGRQWINTSTLFVRQNTATYLITGKLPFDNDWNANDINYDPMPLIESLPTRSVPAVVEYLAATLLGGQIAQPRRDQLIDFMNQRAGGINQQTLVGLLLLITAMPEYQLT